MEVADCSELVDAAVAHLRLGFQTARENGVCRVLSPIVRRDGDPFEVFVHPAGDTFEVTDEGDTLEFLQLSGIHTRKNRALDKLIAEVAKAHNVSLRRGAIVATGATTEQVGEAIVHVVAAMNDVSQFELTRRSIPPRTFDTLVEGELVGQNVPYENRVAYRGEIRERTFRFGINGAHRIVIEPFSVRSSTRAVELAAVLIVGVEDVWRREPQLAAVAVLDDRTDVWSKAAVPDLSGSGINVVRWSSRHEELPLAISSPRRGIDRG